jgi:hypothetical protein
MMRLHDAEPLGNDLAGGRLPFDTTVLITSVHFRDGNRVSPNKDELPLCSTRLQCTNQGFNQQKQSVRFFFFFCCCEDLSALP